MQAPTPEQQEKTLREIARVVGPLGFVRKDNHFTHYLAPSLRFDLAPTHPDYYVRVAIEMLVDECKKQAKNELREEFSRMIMLED